MSDPHKKIIHICHTKTLNLHTLLLLWTHNSTFVLTKAFVCVHDPRHTGDLRWYSSFRRHSWSPLLAADVVAPLSMTHGACPRPPFCPPPPNRHYSRNLGYKQKAFYVFLKIYLFINLCLCKNGRNIFNDGD